jgi:iron complex outermembrane receptor protein
MRASSRVSNGLLFRGGSVLAVVMALTTAGGAQAQTVASAADSAQSGAESDEITVTGSRIDRAGFDAPTPTTVVGEAELRQGNRPSIAQVLNDMPQFRATSTPSTTTGNTNNSASTADLRGLGAVRTLTLLNGHRFNGSSDLNTLPQSIIKNVDIVTGGASAAWGSGAVAGVVNILLDDKFTGIQGGVQTGIASRGDTARYGANLSLGTNFAGDRGHFMIAGEYLQENGAFGRTDRPNLDAAVFQRSDGQLLLANNVNYTIINTGGSVLRTNATPYNLVFNQDGSISPLQLGSQTAGQFTVGGGGQSLYDYVAVSSPYKRANVFARASFEISDAAKIWVDGNYSRVTGDFPFFPETPTVVIQSDNAYLSPGAKTQLAAAGVTYPFVLGRILTDVGENGYMSYRSARRNLEGAFGIDGTFGGGWKYSLYYDHGELRNDQSVYNQRITAKFNRATDAVVGTGGSIVCRVNADAVTTNDDPACAPINLFGSGNVSSAAFAYAFGAARQISTTKLDAAGGSLRGQPFSTWAGEVDVAVGGDFRWESLKTNYIDPLSAASAFSSLNFAPTNGSFNVKEGFAEVNVPLLDLPGAAHVEVNGAARYSDYSTSGGIWSWKFGGTARIAQDLLFRGTYSRDIRSPTIGEYYTTRGTNIGNAQDPFVGAPQANVVSFVGGNPGLTPETAHTLTIGGSYSPQFFKGLRLSVDYYKIDIKNVIATLTLQDTLNGCFARNPGDPTCGGLIARNPNGSIASVTRTNLNLAEYKTRGLDFEASYELPLSKLSEGTDGSIRFRALATHVMDLFVNDGVRVTNRAGIVGDTTTFSTPKWRGTGSITYQDQFFALDLRMRYVGGGIFSTQTGANGKMILNNDIASRTYFDIGTQFKVGGFTLFATVNNVLDRDPPLTTYATPIYDMIGRYFSGGVKVKF